MLGPGVHGFGRVDPQRRDRHRVVRPEERARDSAGHVTALGAEDVIHGEFGAAQFAVLGLVIVGGRLVGGV